MKEPSLINLGRVAKSVAATLPVFVSPVQAGFPSPADDYIDDQLNLHQMMVKHPAATFFVRVEGDSMKGAGIHAGDILVVDKALEPASGDIIVAVVDGEFTVKRLYREKNEVFLLPENDRYPKMRIQEGMDFRIWGVVTFVVHKTR